MASSSGAAASPLTCHHLGLGLRPHIPSLSLRRCSTAVTTAASFPSKPISLSHSHSLPKPLTIAPTHRLLPPISAAAAQALTSPPPKPALQGAAIKPLLATISMGVLVWLIPPPAGVACNAWQLLAIFLATIVGIISQPLPLGAVALLGLGAAVLTRTLTFAAVFGDPIPWLIALTFFFAREFIKTGLRSRVAYAFVSAFGGSSLGLGYSLVFAEALLAPAIPSVSARNRSFHLRCSSRRWRPTRSRQTSRPARSGRESGGRCGRRRPLCRGCCPWCLCR